MMTKLNTALLDYLKSYVLQESMLGQIVYACTLLWKLSEAFIDKISQILLCLITLGTVMVFFIYQLVEGTEWSSLIITR